MPMGCVVELMHYSCILSNPASFGKRKEGISLLLHVKIIIKGQRLCFLRILHDELNVIESCILLLDSSWITSILLQIAKHSIVASNFMPSSFCQFRNRMFEKIMI